MVDGYFRLLAPNGYSSLSSEPEERGRFGSSERWLGLIHALPSHIHGRKDFWPIPYGTKPEVDDFRSKRKAGNEINFNITHMGNYNKCSKDTNRLENIENLDFF